MCTLYQIVWKHHNWHGASARHQVFAAIAAFMRLVRNLGSLRNEILRYALHIEVKVLVSVHM